MQFIIAIGYLPNIHRIVIHKNIIYFISNVHTVSCLYATKENNYFIKMA